MTRWVLDDSRDAHMHQATHYNHPSVVWCRASRDNYVYLHGLTDALCKEYKYRYGKTYKGVQTGLIDMLATPPTSIPNRSWTEPTPAMPDAYIVPGDSQESYRKYYRGEKRHIAQWTNRDVPEWFY